LISKGRNDEALVVLAKYHANGDKHDELVQHEFHQICNTISIEALEPRSWGSFFSSKGDIHRLVICVMVGLMQEWAGNGKIYAWKTFGQSWLTLHRNHLLLSGSHFGLCGSHPRCRPSIS
jgi:hypothetical protein